MAVTAKLKVILTANDVAIAESEDEALWQAILASITTGNVKIPSPTNKIETVRAEPVRDADGPIIALANRLQVSVDDLVGACEPKMDPPFLHLDGRYWESFRQNTPERGRNAVGPIQLAGTLLALWFNAADLGNPTQAQAQIVLRTIGLRDGNPSRGISNCEWLQTRNGGIQINPARTSDAHRVARAFCTQKAMDRAQ